MKLPISRIPDAIWDTPKLSAEEEWNLVERMQAAYTEVERLKELETRSGRKRWLTAAIEKAQLEGDDLRGELVLSYMRFAAGIAKKYQDSNWTFEELLSEAYSLMLEKAVRFRNRRGKMFANYIGFQIKYRILVVQGLLDQCPTLNAKKTIKVRRRALLPHEGATQGTVLDTLVEADPASPEARVLEAYRTLRPKVQEAMNLRLGLDCNGEMSLRDTAREMGIPYPTVQGLNRQGVKKLQEALN